MQFKSLFTFITALLFTTVYAAPQPGFNDAGLSLTQRGCDVCGNVCGSDLKSLIKQLKTDIENVVDATNEVISLISSKKACQCEIDDAIKAKIEACLTLVTDLVSSIFTINWFCMSIALIITILDCFSKLLNCAISFVICIVSYIIAVKLTIVAEVFKLLLSIPQAICECLQKICKAVPTIAGGCLWLVTILLNAINQCTSTCKGAGHCYL